MKGWKIKILNCIAAAALVFLGGFSAQDFTYQTFLTAAIAGGVVLVSQFKEWLTDEEIELRSKKKTALLAFF